MRWIRRFSGAAFASLALSLSLSLSQFLVRASSGLVSLVVSK